MSILFSGFGVDSISRRNETKTRFSIQLNSIQDSFFSFHSLDTRATLTPVRGREQWSVHFLN